MTFSLRYLVVGLGNIGRKRRDVLGGACVATADPFMPDADYRDPLEVPPSAYDAAILAVPNDAKLDLVRELVAAGKSVLVEKPMLFPDRGVADDLAATCRRAGAIWYTSYNHRFEPSIAALRSELKDEAIGLIHHARLFYGNGTVSHVAKGWRSAGLGVIEDLGSHLLDLAGLLIGCRGQVFSPWTLHRFEAPTYDHAVLASDDGRIELEMSFLSWRNTFSIDLFGTHGSAHVAGLDKWGGSELVVRERVFPSGVPKERSARSHPPDVTWRLDLEHFESVVESGELPLENDWWISETMHRVPA